MSVGESFMQEVNRRLQAFWRFLGRKAKLHDMAQQVGASQNFAGQSKT